MRIMDYSNFPLSGRYYGGSEKKISILIDSDEYMLKFQKDSPFGKRFNHVSEYIGSSIFRYLGFDVQEVYLGTYNGEQVVACKNFIGKNQQFVPFNDIGESTLDEDKEKFQYSYEDIMEMLRINSKLADVSETIDLFWDMFVVDAFIGNFDRHGYNWGFIKENNVYRASPIFDNGSCMYPQMNDEDEMVLTIRSAEETDKRVYSFPTSQVKLNGRKSSYYDVISSLEFDECNKSLKRIYPRIDLKVICKLIDSIDLISDIHKEFYKHMLTERYYKILAVSYHKLMEKES